MIETLSLGSLIKQDPTYYKGRLIGSGSVRLTPRVELY